MSKNVVQTRHEALSNTIDNLKDQIGELTKEIDTLKTELTPLQNDSTKIQTFIDTGMNELKNEMKKYISRLQEEYNSKIESLQKGYNSKIESLTKDVNELRQEYATGIEDIDKRKTEFDERAKEYEKNILELQKQHNVLARITVKNTDVMHTIPGIKTANAMVNKFYNNYGTKHPNEYTLKDLVYFKVDRNAPIDNGEWSHYPFLNRIANMNKKSTGGRRTRRVKK